MATFKPYTMC